jgi:hypothetical protein
VRASEIKRRGLPFQVVTGLTIPVAEIEVVPLEIMAYDGTVPGSAATIAKA